MSTSRWVPPAPPSMTEGPGNVDHIMWVTMTEDGPEIANIALKGVFDRQGLDPSLFGAYDRKGAEAEAPEAEAAQ